VQADDLGKRLYGTSLLEIDWRFGDSNARLLFGDGSDTMVVHLVRIHCLMTRKSLRSTFDEHLGPDCHVHFADTVAASQLVRKYLQKELGTVSEVIHYDVNGHAYGESAFVDPLHLCVVCATCHIDVLCDSITLSMAPA